MANISEILANSPFAQNEFKAWADQRQKQAEFAASPMGQVFGALGTAAMAFPGGGRMPVRAAAPRFATSEGALGMPRQMPRSDLTDNFAPMEWGPPSFMTKPEAQAFARDALPNTEWYAQEQPYPGGYKVMFRKQRPDTQTGFETLKQFLGLPKDVEK